RRGAGTLHRADRRGGQRQGGPAVRRPGQPGPVRAGGEPAGPRPPGRLRGAGGGPGGQGGGLGPGPGGRGGGAGAAGGAAGERGECEGGLAGADAASTAALPGQAGLIALDLHVTPELAAEGTARDVVRIVQQARRDAGLAVSDRIRLTLGADGAVADAVRAHAGFVAAETLAVDLDVLPSGQAGGEPHPGGDAARSVALSPVVS